MFGMIYLCAALYLNARFLYHVVQLYREYSHDLAHRTFSYSIHYLFYLFAWMLIDHYLGHRLLG